MIQPKSVQEVLDTARIEEVIQDFVTLKRRGSNMIGLCPFHAEKTPSFSVSPSKGIYKCFGCGKSGNAVGFLMEHEMLSFPEAIRWLAGRYGIELEETETSEKAHQEKQLADSLYLINEFALEYYQQQLFETDRGRNVALSYFKKRGFREEIIRKFGLGYAPNNWDSLATKALNTGYNMDHVRKLGLTNQKGGDFFRDRAMFTIRNISGKVVGFAGRILQKDTKAPKYINSPESEIYVKNKVLYGAHFARQAIRKEDACILVEGYTDVLSLHQAGIENVVASSGTSLTEGQVRLIKRYSQNMVILYDGDAAGTKAAVRGLDMVLEQDMNVKVVMLPEGEDPDSYLQAVGTTEFKAYLKDQAKDFILFKASLLVEEAQQDPVRKTELVRDLIGSLAKIPDPIKRSFYVRECSRLMGIEEVMLVAEINKVLGTQIRKKRQQEQRSAPQKEEAPEELAVEETRAAQPEVTRTDEYQEKDIVRILIEHGHKPFEQEVSVAAFILHHIEEVIQNGFDNKLYQRIVQLYHERVTAGKATDTVFFTHHSDPEIRRVAIDLVHTPYEYSENWEKKWEIFIAKSPDENFRKDALHGLKHFNLRKVRRYIHQNTEKMKATDADLNTLFRVHQELKLLERALCEELGVVVHGG